MDTMNSASPHLQRLIIAAIAAHRRKDWPELDRCMEQLVIMRGGDRDWAGWGFAAEQREQLDRAVRRYVKALGRNANNRTARLGLERIAARHRTHDIGRRAIHEPLVFGYPRARWDEDGGWYEDHLPGFDTPTTGDDDPWDTRAVDRDYEGYTRL